MLVPHVLNFRPNPKLHLVWSDVGKPVPSQARAFSALKALGKAWASDQPRKTSPADFFAAANQISPCTRPKPESNTVRGGEGDRAAHLRAESEGSEARDCPGREAGAPRNLGHPLTELRHVCMNLGCNGNGPAS
jgi:hypothetical protein